MEAIKTMFKGKEFRSKTEAMFALILDKSQGQYSRWTYEEQRFKTPSNYVPDFVRYYGVEAFLSDFISVIELKPSIPTQTYIEHLEKQFNWLKANDKFEFINWYCLCIFNPYDRICEQVILEDGKLLVENLERPAWFKDEYFDMVLNYRFDLMQ